jgi:hypothetical protein
MPTEHFTRQLPSLYNGVSQQPATVRLASQSEAVVNCYQTVVDGVRKRPPSQHVAKLDLEVATSAFLHTINRDVINRFTMVITGGDLSVFDMAGVKRAVNFPGGKAYLASADPRAEFAAVSVADYTFIVNKSVVVEMEAVGVDQLSQAAYYYWLQRQQLAAAVAGTTGSAYQYQYPANPAVGSAVTGSVQTFQDLPETPTEGQVYQIKGNSESNFTSYFVRRTGGVWEECVKPGLRNRIKAETMAWALVRNVDGTFTFAPFSWAPRRVGDETTNPNPTFVGRAIRDITFSKNRLVVLADENTIWSGVGDFGNYYRLTVTDILPDGPIDVAVSTAKVSILNFAVPFNNATMLFADQTQFMLTADQQIGTTAGSLSADVSTEYDCSSGVRPASLGSNVYFTSENGDNAKVWEYFVRDDGVATDAADITAHVPKYIPAGVTKLTASSEHDLLTVLSSSAPSTMYVYKMYWQGDEKAQSSWSRWEFDASTTLLNAELLDDYVYTVVSRGTGVFLEKIHLQAGAHPPGVPFEVYLDRRCAVTGVYLVALDKTEFTLPYVYSLADIRLVKGGGYTGSVGALIDPASYQFTGAQVIRVPGNHAGVCYAGYRYEQRLTFSEQFVQNAQGVSVNTGRLQLRSMTVYFVDTSYFRTEVDPYGDGAQSESVEIVPSLLSEFTGKTIGSSALILGKPSFESGSYTFQLYAPSTSARVSLVNDTHVGSTFQKAEVEMFYFNRSST